MSEVYTPLEMETPAQQVDRQMSNCQQVVERREQMLRLLKNKDFKDLFMRFYLVDEAARLGQMSGHLGLTPADAKGFMDMCQATGHLKRFIDITIRQGEQALADLAQMRENYEELIKGEED
jgi:hypothetical protein